MRDTEVEKIPISLAYAPTDHEHLYIECEVNKGTQLMDALTQTGWLAQYPELAQWCEEHKNEGKIDNKAWRVGVFSYKKPLNYELKSHDRVEVYRPLTIDPMRKRKKRATQQ